jgi:hypothetical protein
VPNKSLFERRAKLFRRCSADAFRDQQFDLLAPELGPLLLGNYLRDASEYNFAPVFNTSGM